MDGGEIKQAFTGTRGKVLLAIGAGGALYLWWTRSRTPTSPQVDPVADGLHAPGTGSPPGGSTGSGVVPGTPAGSDGRPTTNAEWLDKAVKILSNPPWNYSATGVWNAIMKAFQGSPITPMEENWIRAAMSALGSPPEGMPPLNITAPTTPPQGPPPPPDTKPKRTITVAGGYLVRHTGYTVDQLRPLNPTMSVAKANRNGFISASNPDTGVGTEWAFSADSQTITVPS